MIMRLSIVFLVSALSSGCCILSDSCKCDPTSSTCEVDGGDGGGGEQQLYGLGLDTMTAAARLMVPTAMSPYLGASIPSRFDLSADFPPPGNQNPQQSCVGWSVAYGLKSYHEKKEEQRPFVVNGSLDPSRVFSPSFVYNQINGGVDEGTNFQAALTVLQNQGAAPWSAMPYEPNNPFRQVSASARQAAAPYRIASWKQIDPGNLTDIKSQIANGYPVMIGALVDASFQRLGRGEVWRNSSGGGGGHAMVVIGYDDGMQAFKLLNSWGRDWGTDGYTWISYSLFPRVVREAFIARDGPNGTSPAPPGPMPGPIGPRDPAEASSIALTAVNHNVVVPGLGYTMRFDGTVNIPAGVGSDVQVVILV
ncbi:MAG TPA: C1 family peptidase, partial [Gemmatimonadaceae bacterium]